MAGREQGGRGRSQACRAGGEVLDRRGERLMGDAANTGGTERAAILLLSLGEGEAAEVLKHMSAKDVQKVGAAMASLPNVTREHAIAVIHRFVPEQIGRAEVRDRGCQDV